MSIFHYIKKTPKTEEIELLVKLKYGQPKPTEEYLNSLPSSVLDTAYKELGERSFMNPPNDAQKKQVLGIYMRQPTHKKKAEDLILASLVLYHSLLGTL